jgi:hypothetical protein
MWLIKKLAHWFPQAQAKIKAQAAELEAKVTKSSLNQLPRATLARLQERIGALTSPQSYQDAVLSQLEEALAQWEEQEDTPNSLVVIGSPVEPLSLLLNETLAVWQQKTIWHVKVLPWSARPQNLTTIKAQLEQEIGSCFNYSPQTNGEQLPSATATRAKEKVLLLIPDLSYCFLRCVEGFDGLEYLCALMVRERSVFWLIGCNDWAWKYLDHVCQINTYCQETFSLPALTDRELKQWLNPVSETIEFNFGDGQDKQNHHHHHNSDDQEEWTSSSEQSYFAQLSDLSGGINSVAGKLWLNSLYCPKSDSEDQSKSDPNDIAEEKNNTEKAIVLKSSTLPNLPNLTKDDRYLLFSLGLHGKMTLSELALSLGETETKIQSQVNILGRLGVIECRQGLIWLNPVYYPRLQKDLANNQFLVNEV